MLANQSLITDIKAIIHNARDKAIRSVDHERTLMYWHIGQRIFEEEQQGKDRADYGSYLIRFIAEQLEPEYGSGFSKRQVELFRQFYRTFPIANTLYSQLSWSQYKLLSRIDNQEKIHFYMAETVKNNWTVRQLERQIYSNLWERLIMSIGILLCAEKNNAVVKITLPENNKTIIASEYKLYLPTEQQLIDEVTKELEKRNLGIY